MRAEKAFLRKGIAARSTGGIEGMVNPTLRKSLFEDAFYSVLHNIDISGSQRGFFMPRLNDVLRLVWSNHP